MTNTQVKEIISDHLFDRYAPNAPEGYEWGRSGDKIWVTRAIGLDSEQVIRIWMRNSLANIKCLFTDEHRNVEFNDPKMWDVLDECVLDFFYDLDPDDPPAQWWSDEKPV